MVITYHLYEKSYRSLMDWWDYQVDIEYTIKSFPMIRLIEITADDFTIRVNSSNDKVKNRVVKAFGRALANDSAFSEFVVYRYGSHRLIVEKK